MTDKKFKVGEPVIVTTKFDSSGRLSWEPEMDEYIGKTGKITCIDEDGDVRLDGKWFFYPRVLEHVKKSHAARILTEKVTIDGVPCRRIMGFEGVLDKSELPGRYIRDAPSFYLESCRLTGAHVFKGKVMEWDHPSGSNVGLDIKLPHGVDIDVGTYAFTGMNVGDIWPEKTFQELLTWLTRAGSRLAKIRKQEKAAWSGKETVEI
jgi:hypothetical protein